MAKPKVPRRRGWLFWLIVAALVVAGPLVGYYIMVGITQYKQMRGA